MQAQSVRYKRLINLVLKKEWFVCTFWIRHLFWGNELSSQSFCIQIHIWLLKFLFLHPTLGRRIFSCWEWIALNNLWKSLESHIRKSQSVAFSNSTWNISEIRNSFQVMYRLIFVDGLCCYIGYRVGWCGKC